MNLNLSAVYLTILLLLCISYVYMKLHVIILYFYMPKVSLGTEDKNAR